MHHCMQVHLSYEMCSSMLLLKFLVYSKTLVAWCTQQTLRSEKKLSSGRLQEVKNNGKSLTVRPKKWSRSLTGGCHLLEVPTVRLCLGKFWCFGLVVVYGRWLLTRSGRPWRFNSIFKFHYYELKKSKLTTLSRKQ